MQLLLRSLLQRQQSLLHAVRLDVVLVFATHARMPRRYRRELHLLLRPRRLHVHLSIVVDVFCPLAPVPSLVVGRGGREVVVVAIVARAVVGASPPLLPVHIEDALHRRLLLRVVLPRPCGRQVPVGVGAGAMLAGPVLERSDEQRALPHLLLEERLVRVVHLVPHRVPSSRHPRMMGHRHHGVPAGVGAGVDLGDPVVHPPVGQHDRVVGLKDVPVRAVNKVVR
eukprot:511978-Hanusia_phi.AAC.1